MRPTLLSLALIAATTVLGPSLAVAWHAGEVVVDGYRLPKDHRFDSQDEKGKRFTVSINEVPGLLKQNKPILDQTANVWVRSPGGKVNDRYVAAAGKDKDKDKDDRIRGTVQSVKGQTATVRTEDGRTVTVDMSKARPGTSDGVQVGDRVVVTGAMTGSKMVAESIRDDRGGAQAGDKDGKDKWQRIHGQVQSVQGSMLRFRADDGRTLDVDMSKVNPEVRRALTQNEKVTVIGFPGAGKNDFRAEYIQQDRGGAGSPAASTKASGSGTPRMSGTVGVIGGSTMDMRTNDGRTLVVDLSEVSPDLVKSLNPGDPITVTGKLSGSNLKAQSLQKASR